MNKKGIAASSSPVIWSVVIVGLILLIAGFIMVGSVNKNVDDAASALKSQVDADLDAAVGSIQGIASSLEVPTVSGTSDICNNVDGCNGLWDVKSRLRAPLADRVLEELTEDGQKDLFRLMEREGINIDDDVDIDSAWVHEKGEMLTDQDPRFGVDETKTATVDILIAVEYTDDDGDRETDYFRVQATVDELENGMSSADVNIDSFEEVRKRFVLPHR